MSGKTMTTKLRKTKVTIGTGDGDEVETTLGDLDDMSKGRRRGVDPDSNVGITTQLASKGDFLTAIRNASREIARAKQDWRTAQEMEAEVVEALDEWLDLESAKGEVKAKRELFKTASLADDDVCEATERTADKKGTLDLQRKIRSDLLVLYAAKFNRRTAESIEPGENRLIILSAKVGKIEPEQMELF